LLEKPKHREEIYGQMFRELYFSEESLGQINRNSKYNNDTEMKVNSYREIIRETAANLIREIKNNIFLYEDEMETASSESSKKYFREKINESGKVKEKLQSQLEKERKLRERFANSNLRLVISIAKKFRDRGVSLEELVQEGNFGLMKAIDCFDYTKNYKFSTYATWWIKQFVNRGIARQGRIVNLPVHVHEFNAQCYGAEIELMHKLNRKPKLEELARYMYDGTLTEKDKENTTYEELVNAIKKSERISQPECFLDKVYKNRNTRNDFSGEDISADKTKVMLELVRKTPGLEKPYVEKQLSEFVRRALTTLTPREEKIIRKRFGIGEARTYTLEEIREDFGVTRERIRQIESDALKKLRLPSRSEKLKIFWD
jgi:RNA polymerase primary sigma factor